MATTLPLLLNLSTLQPSSSSAAAAFTQSQLRGGARSVGYGCRSVRVAKVTNNENNSDAVVVEKAKEEKVSVKKEPLLLRIGVSVVTELLRVFSGFGSSQPEVSAAEEVPVASPAAENENENVVELLRQDYARAYFLTGDFTTSLYDDDCLFADPTIQFRGRDKYQRNLKLLVPFFEEPRLTLFDIREEGTTENKRSINANWNLRTYLRLPWKPLIDVNGSTLYVFGANSKIVKHIESWTISGRQAVRQLFVPSDRAFPGRRLDK